MSHSRGSGSTTSSVKLLPKSVDTCSEPISTPTQSRSPSSTMSLMWPMRGGGGKVHCCHRLGVAQRLQLAPGLALVLADIEMRRQRAGEHHVAALQFAGPARPELVVRQPLVDPGPLEAAVVAARHADAAGRGEQRAVVERRDAGDEHALQRAMLDGPAALGFAEQRHAVDGADQDRVGGLVRPLDVGAAVGEQDHAAPICEPSRPSGGPAARSRSPGRHAEHHDRQHHADHVGQRAPHHLRQRHVRRDGA